MDQVHAPEGTLRTVKVELGFSGPEPVERPPADVKTRSQELQMCEPVVLTRVDV